MLVGSDFSGWTDIRVDSIRVGTATLRTGNTARLTALRTVGGLAMDFSRDGRVEFADFFLLADAYGSPSPWFDFDGSGEVDLEDLYIFADHFGRYR